MTKFYTLSGTVALGALAAPSGPAQADVRNVALMHGAYVDGTIWRGVYDRLVMDHYDVTVVQLPLTSVADDVAAVQRSNVEGLGYVAAFRPDVGESTGALWPSAPNDFTADALRIFEDGHYLVLEEAWLSFVTNGLPEADAIFSARS